MPYLGSVDLGLCLPRQSPHGRIFSGNRAEEPPTQAAIAVDAPVHTQESNQLAAAAGVGKVALQCGLSLGLHEVVMAVAFSVCNFPKLYHNRKRSLVKNKHHGCW